MLKGQLKSKEMLLLRKRERKVDCPKVPLMAAILCRSLPSHLDPPLPAPSINLYITYDSDCTTRTLHMSIPVKPSRSLRMSLRSFSSSFASISQTWPYCIVDLYNHCPIVALQVLKVCLVKGQVSLVWSIGLCTKMILSETHFTSNIFSIHFSATNTPTQAVLSDQYSLFLESLPLIIQQ